MDNRSRTLLFAAEVFSNPVLAVACGTVIITLPTLMVGKIPIIHLHIKTHFSRVVWIAMVMGALIGLAFQPLAKRQIMQSKAKMLMKDVLMIGSAAEQYAIECGLAANALIAFDSLVGAQYFKTGSRIFHGQSSIELPKDKTLGIYYKGIDPVAQITVATELRQYFEPEVKVNDPIWTDPSDWPGRD